MFWNYLKMARRNLWKHKYYTALNIFGLSLGIAGGLVLFQFIRYHLSFDQYHPHAAQLYRVVTDLHLDDGSVVHEKASPLPLTEVLQQEQPAVRDHAVLTSLPNATVGVTSGGQPTFFTEHHNIAFADPHWFNLFRYRLLRGRRSDAPGTAVITQQLARKYFGSEDVIGNILRLDSKFTITITGVIQDLPLNTDFPANLLLSGASFKSFFPEQEAGMQQSWSYINSSVNSVTTSYVQLQEGASPATLEKAIAKLRTRYFNADVVNVYHFRLQPLADIHFNALYDGSMQRSLLVTLGAVGIFLVLIACFNFINLATAQSVKRAKEIGTRKVLGSAPMTIFWQFITETACVVLLAAVLSFAWMALSRSVLRDWLQMQLHFVPWQDPVLAGAVLCLLGFIIGAGGSYPALVMSRFKPADAFRAQPASGGSNSLFRKSLIVMQHVVVQVLLISTCIITLQVHHLKTADLGFNKDAVLIVNIPPSTKTQVDFLRDQLNSIAGVGPVSFCLQPPSSSVNISGSIRYDRKTWESFSPNTILADDHYLQTFGLQLVAGHNLQPSDTVRQFLINETLLHKLGYKDPDALLGHEMIAGALNDHAGTIVGVVKDFNLHSLYTNIPPLLLTSQTDRYRYVAIRLHTADGARARRQIKAAWQSVYPEDVFEYHYLNEQIDQFYHQEDLLHKLINATALIAILISCLGLLGLISFFTIQRTREIGIRKVLGASVPAIVYLLSKDFLQLVCISLVIAAPLAWFGMEQWLRNFAYRVQISGWVFGLTALLSLLITFVTISYQAIRAAMVNPVKSLRAN
ncbi:MAG TPA: ABC transporter permease [Chitinophaga sp.]